MTDPIAEFLAAGGKITRVPRSKRTLTGTHIKLLCQGDMVNLVAYDSVRTAAQVDKAGRRAQRGKASR